MIVSLIIPWMPAITLFLIVALQEMSIPLQAWSVFRPDLILVSLLYWRLYRPDRCTAQLAFFVGLMVDVVSNAPLGLNAFSKTVIIILVNYYGQRLRAVDFIQLLPIILVCVLLDETIQLLLMGLLHGFHIRWSLFIGKPIATLLLAPLIVTLLIRVHHWWLESV